MVQADTQAQQDNIGSDEQYEELQKFLLSLNGVISECLEVALGEFCEAKVSVHKAATPRTQAAGLRLCVALPWPLAELEHLRNSLLMFIKHACDLWAEPRGIEVVGTDPNIYSDTHFENIFWVGIRQKIVKVSK